MGQTAMKKDRRQYIIFTMSIIAIQILFMLSLFIGDGWCHDLAMYTIFLSFEAATTICWWIYPLLLIVMNVLSFVFTAKDRSSAIVFSVLGGAVGGFFAMRKRNPKFKYRCATNYLYIAQILLLYLQPIINLIILLSAISFHA